MSSGSMLPKRGQAIVKSVLSGDTVVLLGRATAPHVAPPEILFTLEKINASRLASKSNSFQDEPGAFEAREFLRKTVVGKSVKFVSCRQGVDRVYGLLLITNPSTEPGADALLNLGVESTKLGLVTPKLFKSEEQNGSAGAAAAAAGGDPEEVEYVKELELAFESAKTAQLGLHRTSPPLPLVRNVKNAVDDFLVTDLVHLALAKKQQLRVVIEYIFDGSRYRCHIVDDSPVWNPFVWSNFTLILAGVNCPRVANPRADPPLAGEPYGQEAKTFVEQRLLQRELFVTLHGTDKSCSCVVATIHHPKGSIAVELLKRGYGKVTDWTARMMNHLDLPALRVAENGAKRTNLGVWQDYKPPTLTTTDSSQLTGQVVEVLSGDTLTILPTGQNYDSEDKLLKLSLASLRCPRAGIERVGKPDEPYCGECKEFLRKLVAGKQVKVEIHYERDIPLATGAEKRAFATILVGSKTPQKDVGIALLEEGLATVQFHKDGEEKSPSYDEYVLKESEAKAAKKGVHSNLKDYKKPLSVDLTDPKKAKAYSGSLIRAGNTKAIVEYVFNGSRFKLFVPSENCHVAYAIDYVRCPQASPPAGSAGASTSSSAKRAEPFGDDAKRFAKLLIHQRLVEIKTRGCTQGGVMTGDLYILPHKRDYALEIVGAGLANLDERKLEYNDVPKLLVDAQTAAQNNKVGLWSIAQPLAASTAKAAAVPTKVVKSSDQVLRVKLSEIRSGSHVFFHIIGDDALKVVDVSMKEFTKTHGLGGAPCDLKGGKVVAALFDDGSGKSWYRAKILGRVKTPGIPKVSVLFIDHGNVASLPISTHLRPLDPELGPNRIPPVAKEAILALCKVRPLEDDDGIEAARLLQSMAWGKELVAIKHTVDPENRAVITLYTKDAYSGSGGESKSINEELVTAGYARAAKQVDVDAVTTNMVNSNSVVKLAASLQVAQEQARKYRAGMWRYGDIGDEDPDEI